MDLPRGASVPLFPRKYIATYDFPGVLGGLPPLVMPM